MQHQPIFELKDDYLLVITEGEITNLTDLIEDTIKIHEASKTFNVSRIFTDYRKVNFHVPLNEAFNLVRYYENRLPSIIGEISLVTIVNNPAIEIAKFWESICNKRGFNVAVFTDYEAGKEWLLKQAVYK
jgi:hypothetical protein